MIVNMDIPRDIVHIILEYDGQIRHRRCKYIDVIPKTDPRRNMLDEFLTKKAEILENIEIDGGNFFIEIVFETHPYMGLSYDYQWSQSNKYEICFFSYKNNKTILKYKSIQ